MADQGEKREEKKKSKKNKEKCETSKKTVGETKKSGAWGWSSLKRTLIVSVGTSSYGKGAILNNLPFETQNLIRALVSLTTIVRGEEAAGHLETNMFRLLCELFSSHTSKEISYKDLLVADPCLREAFEVLMKLLQYYENNPYQLDLSPGFKRAEELLNIAVELMTAVLEEKLHWEGDMLDRLGAIVRTAGNAEFLAAVWDEPELSDPLLDLHDAMQKYNAFHYYSKSTGMRSQPSVAMEQRYGKLLIKANEKINQKVMVGPAANSPLRTSSSTSSSSSAP